MKRLLHILFTVLFASSLACLNAPMFDQRKHEIFAKTSHEWVPVLRGIKANGLQRFSVLAVEIWALNIEKAIEKLRRKLGFDEFDVIKAQGSYWVFLDLQA